MANVKSYLVKGKKYCKYEKVRTVPDKIKRYKEILSEYPEGHNQRDKIKKQIEEMENGIQ